MKFRVYILVNRERGSIYGIGTYIEQLAACMKDGRIDFTIVNLYSDTSEIRYTESNGTKQLFIPKISLGINQERYLHNVAYILRDIIPQDDCLCVFHVNYLTSYHLVNCLKELFRCKIVFTLHYTNWSFRYLGNYSFVKNLLSKPPEELKADDRLSAMMIRSDKEMLKKCDRIICIADHSQKYMTEIYEVPLAKTTVINNALRDTYEETSEKEIQSIKTKLHLPLSTKVVIFAGRLEEVKGVSFLIKSFGQVVKSHPNTHLFIAGDGNEMKKYLSEAYPCGTKITFTGFLDKERLYDLYKIADIGIVCSLHEEFGFTAIEMMMMNIPLVVSDTTGLSEIVEDNCSGFKVPVIYRDGSPQLNTVMLSEKIRTLLDDPQTASRFKSNGRKKFIGKYNTLLWSRKMLELYRSLCETESVCPTEG